MSVQLEVRAIDAAGNHDPAPAVWRWTVHQLPTEISIERNPPKRTCSKQAKFRVGVFFISKLMHAYTFCLVRARIISHAPSSLKPTPALISSRYIHVKRMHEFKRSRLSDSLGYV